MAKIDVIVPACGMESYIASFLNTMASQLFSDFHLYFIVSEKNPNSDVSTIVLPDVLKGRTTFLYYPNEYEGPGLLRDFFINNGQILKSEYCIFFDVDDNPKDNILLELYEKAKYSSADITSCGYTRISKATGTVAAVEMIHNPAMIDVNTSSFDPRIAYINGSVWNKLIRSECIKDANFRKREIEDLMFQLEMLPRIRRYAFVNSPLYDYYIQDMTRVSVSQRIDFFKCIEPFIALSKKYGEDPDYRPYIPIFQLVAFIRIGIGKTIYCSSLAPKETKHIVKSAKKFFDSYLPGWRKNKLIGLSSVRKGGITALMIWICRTCYKINLFAFIVSLYNKWSQKSGKIIRW